MNENKKHKLIKYKRKLVPIAFGLIMPIVSVVSAADGSNNPSSGKSQQTKDEIQNNNLEALKKVFVIANVKIKNTNKTATDIANSIKNLVNLKDELGIDLTKLEKVNSKYSVSVTVDKANSKMITISVTMTTDGATSPESEKLTLSFTKEELVKNETQKQNLEKLMEKFKGGAVKKASDKATDIAGRIKDQDTLKNELGIDLTRLPEEPTYDISAMGYADGKITVTVKMRTDGATSPEIIRTYDVQHKSDSQLKIAKALQDAKDKAKGFINSLKLPTQNDAKHDASLFGNIAKAKQAALSTIDGATTPQAATDMASSKTAGTEVEKVLAAIQTYKSSTGTEAKALQDAKDKAKGFINSLKLPTQNDAKHDASLFGNIAKAKQAALSTIDGATTPQAATDMASSKTAGTEVEKVLAAIQTYKSSTGTEAKALQDAKDKAKGFINSLKLPTQNDAKHEANKFGNIAKAKQAALSTIDGATTPQAATAMASSKTAGTEVEKVLAAIQTYKSSTGTEAKALQDAKDKAKGFINSLNEPQDDAKHDASLFGNIAKAKQAALSTIDGATTPQAATAMASSKTAGTEVEKVLAAIQTYKSSTGTEAKALQDAKDKAKGFINSLNEPQDDAKHDASLFGNIAKAKQAALSTIDGATTPQAATDMASSKTAGTEVEKVLAAIQTYKSSTGTEAKALQDAKDKAKGFINSLKLPTQNDAKHEANKFGNIAKAKQAALSTIDGATTPQAATAMASSKTAGTEVAKVLAAIQTYKGSTGTEAKALQDAKDKAKGFINSLKLPTQNDAKHEANKFGNIAKAKQAALSTIDGATTPQAATAMASSKTAGTEVEKVLAAIQTYKSSTGTEAKALQDAKDKAKGFINSLNEPQDDAKHDASLFGNIAKAKQAALSTIDGATTPQAATAMASSKTAGTEVEKVLAAIQTYKSSTGTEAKALQDAKDKAKGFINSLNEPQDDAKHDASLFGNIAKAKQAALSTIDGATTPQAATAMASSKTAGTEVEKVLAAIQTYKSSTGTEAKALQDAKDKAKGFINSLKLPTQNDAKHDASLFGNIAKAKQAALSTIDGATTPQAATAMASSKTAGTEVEKVLAAIQTYKSSTGTEAKALQDAKDKAKGFINSLKLPTQNDAKHEANKFGNIAKAKQAALSTIDGATTPQAATAMASSKTAGTEVEKVLAAIQTYKSSTGTEAKALQDAKDKAKGFINSLKLPTQNDAKHEANKFGNIDKAKQAALSTIDGATTPQAATAMASSKTAGTEVEKVLAAIQTYKSSTGTEAKALQDAKDKAKGFINSLKLPTQNDAKHEANKFGNIDKAKQAALSTIDGATTPQAATAMASSKTAGTEVEKVLAAIQTYKSSTGTEAKALQDAKDKAKGFINSLNEPQDDAKHDASLFGNIAKAKQAALSTIDGATTPQAATAMASSKTAGTEVEKVLAAIQTYKSSTGTEAKALQDAKDKAKGFINSLKLPTQNDAKHDASLFGNIAKAKQAALSTIDGATTPQAATAMASSKTAGTEVEKVLAAIQTYKSSTGTEAKALQDAKDKAKGFINSLNEPQDDAKHDASLFGNIAKAKQAALSTIDGATTPQAATAMASSPTVGTELVKVKAAIDAYNKSTAKAKTQVSKNDKDSVKTNTTKKVKKSKTKIIIISIVSAIGAVGIIIGIAFLVKRFKK